MDILIFMLVYILLLGAGAFFILGWKNVTEGRLSVYPDGKVVAAGKLFKWFSLFIEKEVGTEKIFFGGDQLLGKLKLILTAKPTYYGVLSFDDETQMYIIVEKSFDLSSKDLEFIESISGATVSFYEHNILLSQEFPVYRFPEWVRNPLVSCIECMPSVYGSLIWWGFNLMQTSLWNWTDNILAGKLFFWFIYIISLSWINKYLHRKTSR